MPSSKSQGDFNPNEMVKSETHKKDIDLLTQRLERLENKLGNNECLADTLYEASTKVIKMRTMIGEVVEDTILHDPKTAGAIKKVIDETDRDSRSIFFKKFGNWIYILASFVIGSFVQALIAKFVK